MRSDKPREQGEPAAGLPPLWWRLVYPQLAGLPHELWRGAIERARETELTVGEYVAMLSALAVVSAGLGVDEATLAGDWRAGLFINRYLLALPLLAVMVGPVLLRRTRRGLRIEVERARLREDVSPQLDRGGPP